MNINWGDFWSFIWLFFWGFAVIVYLSAIFIVLSDLFRDRTLNGWWKAVWILFLIFVPFLTVLVYVITRARGMVDRLESDKRFAQPDVYVSAGAGASGAGASPAAEIEHSKQLLDRGVISADEFGVLKSKALSNRS